MSKTSMIYFGTILWLLGVNELCWIELRSCIFRQKYRSHLVVSIGSYSFTFFSWTLAIYVWARSLSSINQVGRIKSVFTVVRMGLAHILLKHKSGQCCCTFQIKKWFLLCNCNSSLMLPEFKGLEKKVSTCKSSCVDVLPVHVFDSHTDSYSFCHVGFEEHRCH